LTPHIPDDKIDQVPAAATGTPTQERSVDGFPEVVVTEMRIAGGPSVSVHRYPATPEEKS
jgi:hypothetical protein